MRALAILLLLAPQAAAGPRFEQTPSNAMRDPNNLLMPGADGTFVEAGDTAGIGDDARSRGGALADFDGDRRLDLIVSARRAPLRLWQNHSEAGQ